VIDGSVPETTKAHRLASSSTAWTAWKTHRYSQSTRHLQPV
jgi:hypothetical protein